jgi:hypothetical protein
MTGRLGPAYAAPMTPAVAPARAIGAPATA